MTKKIWLCRDRYCKYEIFPLAKCPERIGRAYIQYDSNIIDTGVEICAKFLQRMFPHLKMKPGDAPRRVEITMEFCD